MNDATKAKIARIDQISALARSSWIGLLAYLAFVFITLLGVQDADFFVPSRQTQLPLVNVSIPTASFFVFGPVLAAALYIYLHLFLLKLSDAIAEAPPTTQTDESAPPQPLGETIHPWLFNDVASFTRHPDAYRRRPLRWFTYLVTALLVWVAGPFVIAWAWVASFPAHNDLLTLAIATCLILATLVGLTTARIAFGRFRPRWWKGFNARRRNATTLAFIALLITAGMVRTNGNLILGLGLFAAPFAALATTQFRSLNLAFSQLRWKNHHRFNAAFLRVANIVGTPGMYLIACVYALAHMELLPPDGNFGIASARLTGNQLVPLPPDWRTPEVARRAFRETWCKSEGLEMKVCGHLTDADTLQPANILGDRLTWCAAHTTAIEDCPATFADKDTAFRLAWEDERRSTIAALPDLDLTGRDLRGAVAERVSLVGATLTGARMEGADLSFARMEGANLREARLEGANLWQARMEGAVLIGADLRSADWVGAYAGSLAQFADLRGASNLTQAQLDQMIGNVETLLPETLQDGTTPTIPSCWETEPDWWEQAIDPWRENNPFLEPAYYLCRPGQKPQPTGTVLALNRPRPGGHPLGTGED